MLLRTSSSRARLSRRTWKRRRPSGSTRKGAAGTRQLPFEPALRWSAGASRQHAEEALDIRVRACIPVAVEVRAGARGAAVPGQAREEGLDVRVRAAVAVVVE